MRLTRKTPGGVPPIAKVLGSIIVLLVMVALGWPLTTGGPPGSPAPGAGGSAGPAPGAPPAGGEEPTPDDGLGALRTLIDDHASGRMVTVRARVYKVLDDDNDGARHQRFLIGVGREGSRVLTVKVAHNVELAPRVPVEEGDVVLVHGEFEFNDLGGVIHWTHHDPGGRHEGGWIEHAGRRYE